MIEISTARLPEQFRDYAEVAERVRDLFWRFNCGWFDQKRRTILCLHEGTHVLYKRMCGFDPKIYGPSVAYVGEEFWSYEASTEGIPDEIEMNEDPHLVAKANMGPVYVEEKLLEGGEYQRPFKEIWAMAKGDLRCFNTWYCKRLLLKGDVKGLNGDKIRASVYRDLRSPEFRRKIWDAAREFEARVFGLEAIGSREAA